MKAGIDVMSAGALRNRAQAHTLALVAALLAWPVEGSALECPAMPQQSQRDIDVAVGIANRNDRVGNGL